MSVSEVIKVFEYECLWLGDKGENGAEFRNEHFVALRRYLTANPDCGYYSLLDGGVCFCQYVGALQVGDLLIEILPKTDRHGDDKDRWQEVLIDMIELSHRISVKTTTTAQMLVHKRRVLDVYVQLFLDEVERLLHEGLVKKYRSQEANQFALRGKLLVHKQVQNNIVHAERFYVSHQVYDRDNIYNAILYKALNILLSGSLHPHLARQIDVILLYFPECQDFKVSQKLFRRLRYDRKTARYKSAISFAEIILMNYHPDVRNGRQSILAIMFDMNTLWEAYIFDCLQRAVQREKNVEINEKPYARYWQPPAGSHYGLEPDILLTIDNQNFVLDTKWKYNSRTSIQDVRQMYAYGHYFQAKRSYLIYPDKLVNSPVKMLDGYFYEPVTEKKSEDNQCGLIYIDLLDENGKLNSKIGDILLSKLKSVKNSNQ